MWRNIVHDEVFRSLLLEAKSPEEILRLIKYRYGNSVPDWFIDKVLAMDPTKKKSFTRWACDKYGDESEEFENDLDDGTLKKVFDYFYSNSGKFSLADIDSLQAAKDYAFTVHLDEYLQKSGDGEENDYDYWDVDDQWMVLQYHSYEASLKLGKDCVWCTANWYGNGESYYKKYTNGGDIFILVDKTESEICNKRRYDFERYQVFFSDNPKESEFRNSKNETVENNEIGITENVEDFFSERGLDITEVGRPYEERYEDYLNWRWENFLMSFKVGDYVFDVLPVYEEEMDIRNEEDCWYGVYDDDSDTSEIPHSPSESREFYENAVFTYANTFTILKSEDFVYLWYVDRMNRIHGDWTVDKDYSYEAEGPFKYAYVAETLVVEHDGANWSVDFGKEKPRNVMFPEQLDDGSVHACITSENDVTYLVKFSQDGGHSFEKYTRKGVFELRNGRYVVVPWRENAGGENGEGEGMIEGKYALMDLPSTDSSEWRFLPCLDIFERTGGNIRLYDKENGEVLPYVYRRCEVYGGHLFLGINRMWDVFNPKTGEFLIRRSTPKTKFNVNNVILIAGNNGEGCIFFKFDDESARIFRAKEAISYDEFVAFIICDKGRGLLYLDTLEFVPGVDYMLAVRPGEYIVVNGENVLFSGTLGDDGRIVADTVIGRIDPGSLDLFKHDGRLSVLAFMLQGSGMYSLYDYVNNKMVLKDWAERVYGGGDTDLVFLQTGDGKFQAYDMHENRLFLNGFKFDHIEKYGPSLLVTRPLVTVYYGISENPSGVYPKSITYKSGSGTGQIPYYELNLLYNNGVLPERCVGEFGKEHFEQLMEIKREIENASKNTSVNESMARRFYSILEGMDGSKYNWL